MERSVDNVGISVNSNEASAAPDGRALLTIYISGGQIKEYDLSAAELNHFLFWYAMLRMQAADWLSPNLLSNEKNDRCIPGRLYFPILYILEECVGIFPC